MKHLELETKRTFIRKFKPEDWKDLYEYLSKEEVVKHEPYDVMDEEACKAEAIRRATDDNFYAVVLKEENKVIGNIYFAKQQPEELKIWEIGYVFNSDYWKKGYATESCNRMMQYGFETLSAHRIIAMCNPINSNSWQLLERLHMRREAHFVKDNFFYRTKDGAPIWIDTYQYGILAEEFFSFQ